ncbi:helicase, Snf2 family [Helicobacter fennelliae]|uniref:Helicase, Snf2 family n=1 Tax=Helicobacter fennelliae TaxID=215 RepID=A0A2X3ELQ4_9HELI|nr:ArdC-like ssDNA-binding domain-containing protein [Helicobacter fennelliae]SQC36304.1 helicase, Snf2 family [Helicobacter fennelliae]
MSVAYKWDNYTHEERKESFNNYAKYNIIQAIKSQNAPWLKSKSAQEIQKDRPFNAQTGRPYEGLNAILLESKQKEMGYENGSWISAKQANFLGAKLTADQLKTMEGVKISYIKTKEAKQVFDKQGKPKTTPQLDSKGKPRINPKTKEPYYNFVYDIKELPQPILETTTLYHTSQIPSLEKSKLKELDLSLNQPKEISTKFLENVGLTEHTRKQIGNYLTAQAGQEKYKTLPKPEIKKDKENTKDRGMGR